ncbi:hypothetical protein SCUCBS95973_004791 [Sporothrix curviconia]|uniref:HNH nuclease domain-containing protein n=1 Tax=Sporothrix curviconia TaxID=1260050 RepID=A0ABP0BS85_9PEZI
MASVEDLTMVHYVWLANITLDWASFIRSFVRCCAGHPLRRVRRAGPLDGSDGLRAAEQFFEDLRFRYITIAQKAKAPYTDVTSMVRLPNNEIAFDHAIYDIFFGGPRASQRPQQIMQSLMPHYDRVSYLMPSSSVPVESILVSIETVAHAVNRITRRVEACCSQYNMDPERLSIVEEKDDDSEDDDTFDDCE